MNTLKRWFSLFILTIVSTVALCACNGRPSVPAGEADYVSWVGISSFERPVWSPDGTQLALREFKDPVARESARLFLYTFNDKHLTPLSFTSGDYTSVSWSPDTSKLVVAKQNERAYGRDIQVIDLSTETVETIGYGEGVAWAPDGQSIAIYAGPKADVHQAQYAVHLVRPDGTLIKAISLPITSARRESTPVPVTVQPGDFSFPALRSEDFFDGMSWSPDGRWIVISIMRTSPDSGPSGNLYVVNVDDDEVRQITSEGWNREPAWSPDGTTIAYVRMEHPSIFGRIYLVRPDGSCPSPISESLAAQSLSWSPDGNRIAYEYRNSIYILDIRKRLASGSMPLSSCP